MSWCRNHAVSRRADVLVRRKAVCGDEWHYLVVKFSRNCSFSDWLIQLYRHVAEETAQHSCGVSAQCGRCVPILQLLLLLLLSDQYLRHDADDECSWSRSWSAGIFYAHREAYVAGRFIVPLIRKWPSWVGVRFDGPLCWRRINVDGGTSTARHLMSVDS